MTETVIHLTDCPGYKSSLAAAPRDKVIAAIQECYEDGSIKGKLDNIMSDVHHGLNETKPMSELSTAALRVLVRMGEKVRAIREKVDATQIEAREG